MNHLTVEQELTVYAVLIALGLLILAVLAVIALMGILWLVVRWWERGEKQVFTSKYGEHEYGREAS